MARDILYVGDVGIHIQVSVIDRETKHPVDLSGFLSGKLRFRKPDGITIVDKAATKVGDGSTGEIEYVTQSGDLSHAGNWQVQPYQVLTASDGPWTSDPDGFGFVVRAPLA